MPTIKLSRAAPVILIDSSYFFIRRLFATSKWWSIRNGGSTEPGSALTNLVTNVSANEHSFEEAFKKHTESDIQKIQKKWGLIGRGDTPIAPNNIIFCEDCCPSTIWRIDVFDDYKKRYRNGEMSELPDVGSSQETHTHLTIGHARLEADDVACLLFRQIRVVMGSEHPIVIISSDHDYLQLKDDHTEIYSLPFSDLWEAGYATSSTKPTKSLYILLVFVLSHTVHLCNKDIHHL